MTVLVTTHYLDEAEHCHRVAIIHAGKLAALGTTTELKQVFAGRPIVEIQRRRAGRGDAGARRDAGGGEDEPVRHRRPRRAAHDGATPDAIAARLTRDGRRAGRRASAVVQPSLEDVFLDVVERQSGAHA